MTDEPARQTDPDYSRWDDDTDVSYPMRVASQVMWEIGHHLCQIADRLLDAAYPNSSINFNLNDDDDPESER
jgi:hypothetical protein